MFELILIFSAIIGIPLLFYVLDLTKKRGLKSNEPYVDHSFEAGGVIDELVPVIPEQINNNFLLADKLFLASIIKDRAVLFQLTHTQIDPLSLETDDVNDVTIYLSMIDATELEERFNSMEISKSFRKDPINNEPCYSKSYTIDSTELVADLQLLLIELYHLEKETTLLIDYNDRGANTLNS